MKPNSQKKTGTKANTKRITQIQNNAYELGVKLATEHIMKQPKPTNSQEGTIESKKNEKVISFTYHKGNGRIDADSYDIYNWLLDEDKGIAKRFKAKLMAAQGFFLRRLKKEKP